MSGVSRPRVLFVGAFPRDGLAVFGGQVTACRGLMQSSFPDRVVLDLIDSTQPGNPPPPALTRVRLALRRTLRFLRQLVTARPDAVLLFVAVGPSLAEKGLMAWCARLAGVPALVFPRGGQLMDDSRGSALRRLWLRVAFGGTAVLLCQSPTWQRFASDVLGIPASRAPVIPNWTATPDLLRIGATRQATGDGPVRLIFVGWADREKGIGELLEVCRRLAPSLRFTLDIVGEGNASASGRAFVEARGLSSVVRFRGWLTGQALLDAFADADVLVLPSWVEGLPNAMIEAMAAGLAVVVSAVGGIPGVVTDGTNALLVPPQDADALAVALERVIEDRALRTRLAHAGHQLAAERFSVEPAVELILAALASARGFQPVREAGR